MRIVVALLSTLALVLAFTNCAKKATPDDCKKACTYKQTLDAQAKAADLEKAAKEADEALNAKVAELLKGVEAATAGATEKVAALDKELADAVAKDPKNEATLKTDYEAKKAEVAKAKDEQVAAFSAQAEALKKEFEDAKVKKAEEEKADAEAALKACSDACVKAGTTLAKTQCQQKAKTLDEFNKCK